MCAILLAPTVITASASVSLNHSTRLSLTHSGSNSKEADDQYSTDSLYTPELNVVSPGWATKHSSTAHAKDQCMGTAREQSTNIRALATSAMDAMWVIPDM